ncbi:autotransporter outer membrane beta-barrel domain-containing protein [Paradevosia shaoguanensis]|uniref:autotransporter family protein n=1 Tax=Paradevosia shaoguanensis TaxID=1335043 RepID=UPI001932C575|nr:autotransporter outer membrane beta-barrel domain-containing protein [Paradevosia shaoguanensis]
MANPISNRALRAGSLFCVVFIQFSLCSAVLAKDGFNTWTGAAGNSNWKDVDNWDLFVPFYSEHTYIHEGSVSLYDYNIGESYALFVDGSGLGPELTIQPNALMLTQDSALGDSLGNAGRAVVDGSAWLQGGWRKIGGQGTGSLIVKNGGEITDSTAWIGFDSGSVGSVVIRDAGSIWRNSEKLWVGRLGTGTLDILEGGEVSTATEIYLGGTSSGRGTVTVDGDGSTLSSRSALFVGGSNAPDIDEGGRGTLVVSNGGHVSSASVYVGYFGAQGDVTVTGAGSFLDITGPLTVGSLSAAEGTLTVSNGGKVRIAGPVNFGPNTGTGTLNIGAAAGQAAKAPGTIESDGWIRMGTSSSLVFNHTGTEYEFASSLFGGTINHIAGTTILTGDNVFDRLLLNGGIVSISSDVNLIAPEIVFGGGTLRATGNVALDQYQSVVVDDASARFDVTAAGDLTINGRISGTEGIIKTGDGTLTLAASAHDYLGDIDVQSGTLAVNRRLGGLITVGGRLVGDGIIHSAILNDGASFSPGMGLGTMHATGDLTFKSGSTFAVQVDAAGRHDQAFVDGRVSIAAGAQLGVSAAPGSYRSTNKYTLMSAAGGIDGSFGLTSNLYFLDAQLSQTGNDLVLSLIRNDLRVSSAARNPNQVSVGAAIDGLGVGFPLLDAFAPLSEEQASQLLQQISGETHASGQQVIDETFALFAQNLTGRTGITGSGRNNSTSAVLGYVEAAPASAAIAAMADAMTAPASSRSLWLAPVAATGRINGTDAASALDWTSAGITFGLEQATTANGADVLVGLAIGYLHGNSHAGLSDTASNGGQLGAYGALHSGAFTLSGSVSAGLNSSETERRITSGGLDLVATSSAWAQTLGTSLELAYALPLDDKTTISPLALLDAGFGHRSAVTETGAGAFNLAVGEASWGRLVPGLGAEVKHEIALDAGTITATARAAWQHSLLGAPSQTMAFAGTNADFSVQGASAAADRLNLGLGLKFQTDTNFTLSADYAGSLSKNSNQHSVRLAGMGQF